MNQAVVAGVLLVGGVVGGIVGGLLSAYWWDFPGEDVETYGDFIVPFYTTLGAVVGLLAAGLLIAIVGAIRERRRRGPEISS
jgi:hypothetical protein